MKINPNYLALCKQYLIDSKNCNREEMQELNKNLLHNIVSVEETDFDKAISLSKEFKKIDLIEEYVTDKNILAESKGVTRNQTANYFVRRLKANLTFKKQRQTTELIEKRIEHEFPEQEQVESIFEFVSDIGLMPFMKLNLQDHADKFSKQNGIPKQDLLDLLETI